MYTVLIQSKKTMDSLQQFYPLISDAIEAGQIGVCNWVEAGTMIETAVPELYEIISRKRAWRAVIISTELEDADCLHPADAINPFDFLENADDPGYRMENGELMNSEIPLIRLTHLLGGMPAPEPQFMPEILEENGKVPRMEYHLLEDENTQQLKAAYGRWNDKYAFHGMPPTEIILIKVRDSSGSSNSFRRVESSWKMHTEVESSKFWKRNMYPHNCRFLAYDLDRRGMMRQQQELFKLWLCVLLLARNDSDPNALQAHRLYKLDAALDEDELKATFQRVINKLNRAKHQLEKSLKKDEEEKYAGSAKIPEYGVGVPVAFQLPRVSDIAFDASIFQMGKREGIGDFVIWENYCQAANTEIKNLLQNVDRVLDQAAARMRERCSYDEDEVVSLNVYQEEDLRNSLQEVYGAIIEEQDDLPSSVQEIHESIAEADKQVREQITKRMTMKQALLAIMVSLACIWLCFLPAAVQPQARLGLGITLLVIVTVFPVVGYFLLAAQKKELTAAAKNYQRVLSGVVSELSRNATNYSEFLGAIASHIHGSSYLDIMRKKRAKRDSSYFYRQKHIKSIEVLLSKLGLWGSAFHINLDMNAAEVFDFMAEGNELIDLDELYSFSTGKEYPVPLNEIGVDVKSPFPFVRQLKIEREEVYDHV